MLYMFRTPFASINRRTITVTAATSVCHELRWSKSCIDIQGLLRTDSAQPTSIVFVNNYRYAVHVSDDLFENHQEHYKL